MKNKYPAKKLLIVLFVCLVAVIASCKKDKKAVVVPPDATPTGIGLVEESDSAYIRNLFINVSQIGTQTVSDTSDYLFFDTGSGGMVFDAEGIIPSPIYSTAGFNFTGDSVVVNGITITNQTSTIQYGDDANSTLTVYGNLAYAAVTIDQPGGDVVIKRLPFFLTYLAKDNHGTVYPPHSFDVFGVNPEYDLNFSNGVDLQSPFNYFSPGTGLTKGFKIAALSTGNFSYYGNYVNNVVTLGLKSSDLATSSGFSTSTLQYSPTYGYDPYISGTVTYNGKTVSTDMLFDTGTNAYSVIEDPTAATSDSLLPVNSTVAITTTSGFDFSYTTSNAYYVTYVEKSSQQDEYPTIFGIDFFLDNEYMLDIADHKMGVKNN